jgi:hypothetical protein
VADADLLVLFNKNLLLSVVGDKMALFDSIGLLRRGGGQISLSDGVGYIGVIGVFGVDGFDENNEESVEDIEFDLPRVFTDIIGLSNIMGTDGRR